VSTPLHITSRSVPSAPHSAFAPLYYRFILCGTYVANMGRPFALKVSTLTRSIFMHACWLTRIAEWRPAVLREARRHDHDTVPEQLMLQLYLLPPASGNN
jgi:hypothetical protein